jgi:hypothetical protein
MKNKLMKLLIRMLLLFVFVYTEQSISQGMDDPLTIEGLDRSSFSTVSRGQGGTTIGIKNDIGTMFQMPASLQSLEGVQFSVSGIYQSSTSKQEQRYTPLKYYSNFSILMEGLTGSIDDPQYDSAGSYDPGDTVQRPFDNIGPNWVYKKNKYFPMQALIAVPFSIGGIQFAAGVGTIQYSNLNHFYQNNNVLSPSIGSERPFPLDRPRSDSLSVQWYQYIRSREGVMRGHGVVLSSALTEKISLGVSGMLLRGSTEDYEYHQGRGRLKFFANSFRLDSVYNRTTIVGISDYRGTEFTLSGIYRGKYVSIGLSAKLPMTIKRYFDHQIAILSTDQVTTTSKSGADQVKLPWRGTVGLSSQLRENLMVNLEYEIHPYDAAVYTDTEGKESKPWLSSNNLRIGSEYRPYSWLALRGGARHEAEVFEPTGNAIIGDPVTYTAYSVGCGVTMNGIHLNVAYEYALIKYQDIWQTNVNLNQESRHIISADIVYELPLKF